MNPKRRGPRKRVSFRPPPEWKQGTAAIVENDFYVEHGEGKEKKLYRVTERDAWNHNLFVGLQIYFVLEKGECVIKRRAQQNKQFVQI